MTGRRSIGGWDQRLSRALQFNPGHVGGRVASAQPVLRNGGTLRRPSIGAAAVSASHTRGVGGVGSAIAWGDDGFGGYQLEVGDTLLAFAAGPAAAIATPTGWTSLGGGTVGNLAWRLAWRVSDYSGTANYGTFTGTALGGQSQAYGNVAAYLFRGVSLTPTLVGSAATATAVSTHLWPSTSGTWPVQFQGYLADSGAGANWTVDPVGYYGSVDAATIELSTGATGLGDTTVVASRPDTPLPSTAESQMIQAGTPKPGSWVSLAASLQ